MKSILIIPGYRLFPIDSGAATAQYGIIDSIRKDFKVSVLYFDLNIAEDSIAELQERWTDVTFIAWEDIKSAFEEEHALSLSQRIKQKFFPEKPFEMPALELPPEIQAIWDNCAMVYYNNPQWMSQALAHHIAQNKYDLVQTDLSTNLSIVSKLKGVKTVHVCHELKHSRFKRSAESLGYTDSSMAHPYQLLRKQELKLLKGYDKVICFNDDDASQLQELGEERITISPFPVLDSDSTEVNRGVPARIIFLGAESHGPNAEGFIWFLEEIYAKLDNPLPLEVIGRWSEETMANIQREGVTFHGFVEDLDSFFMHSVMVVPVRSGAGIRTKIIQAMAQGVPVISTPFAATGIGAKHAHDILFFDDVPQFEEAIQKADATADRERITQNARDLVARSFSQKILGKLRTQVLHNVINSTS